MTVIELYKKCRRELTGEDSAFELSQLFHQQFGDSAQIIAPDKEVAADEAFVFEQKIKKLQTGYPLQYLLGEWEFYSIPVAVGEGVLIPRADTETLIDAALMLLKDMKDPKIADFCSGSGAIALAMAKHVAAGEIFALEKYEGAFYYLEENIRRNSLEGRIKAIKTDVTGDLSQLKLPKLDMIISNPPYLDSREMAQLQEQVKYEPAMALFGGADGLDFYRSITSSAKALLKNGGYIVFEVGYTQSQKVSDILLQNGFDDIRVFRDLNLIERCVCAKIL